MMSVSHPLQGSWQSVRHLSLVSLGRRLLWLVFAFLAMATTFLSSPTYAAVSVFSVQAQPIAEPISASVTVTDASGNPVTDLTASDFSVSVDGTGITTVPSFSRPQDLAVSVVFAMDYSQSVVASYLAPMQQAVIAFINAMQPGDYAAIVKFNGDSGVSVVQPFTQIDGGTGTTALLNAVKAPYPGDQSNILDATLLSIQQLTSPPTPLPPGPKAVVLISDGAENASSAQFASVVQSANDAKVSIFTVGVGDITTDPTSQQILSGLAEQTAGKFYDARTNAQIGDAYVQVSKLLTNAYLLSFQSTITDCQSHTLEVQVTGQAPGTATFTRCTPLSAPNVRGLTLAAATTKLNSLGLVTGRLPDKPSVKVPAGSVISQDPVVGTVVQPGSTVNLVVSSGMPIVPTDLAGKTESAATDAITQAGLVVGKVTQNYSSTVPTGDVISVSSPYEAPAGGAAVDLVVSAGPLAGGGGGGGATGPFELVVGLLFVAVLAASRRRKV